MGEDQIPDEPEPKKVALKTCPLSMLAHTVTPVEDGFYLEDASCRHDCAWFDRSYGTDGQCVIKSLADHLCEIWSRMRSI